VGDWFQRTIVDSGRLPLFCFFVSAIVAFGFIRFSVRMIRAQVRWWPGNVTPGGTHIHHVVFGVIFMVIGGVAGLALRDRQLIGLGIAASVFGIGTALVFDEFALILHLRDVYWTEQGRTSVDAVFVVFAGVGLLMLGFVPTGLVDFTRVTDQQGQVEWTPTVVGYAISALLTMLLGGITVLKGKIWTGLIGLFIWPLLLVGAVRLARPHSPWARWRYRPVETSRKLVRAVRRERRYRQPLIRAKIWLQELIAGRPDSPERTGG
jgi:hypothetical protein